MKRNSVMKRLQRRAKRSVTEMPDFEFEKIAVDNGFSAVCGVDEAGRGPFAGSVCAAAVILPMDCEIEGLNDSKKLSEKRREALFDVVKGKAITYAIAFASVEEIARFNILGATFLAMERCVKALSPAADFALIDGNKAPSNLEIPSLAVVKGDAKSMSIAAASILAKDSRDRLMCEMGEKYPEYGFEIHKGYGTKAHCAAILAHGACEIHREKFLRKLLGAGND